MQCWRGVGVLGDARTSERGSAEIEMKRDFDYYCEMIADKTNNSKDLFHLSAFDSSGTFDLWPANQGKDRRTLIPSDKQATQSRIRSMWKWD
jgi:hypothetical protein